MESYNKRVNDSVAIIKLFLEIVASFIYQLDKK